MGKGKYKLIAELIALGFSNEKVASTIKLVEAFLMDKCKTCGVKNCKEH